MGMYTEIYVNVDLVGSLPDEVLSVLKAIVDGDYESEVLKNYPDRWCSLFSNSSYYTPYTSCAGLTFDRISNQWSLIGKGDIKNYGNEIQEFFEWLSPYVEGSTGDFIGYYRYEESQEPTLVYL